MNQVDIRVFLHGDKKITEINEGNEWLAALLSGEALKKKPTPAKAKRFMSNSQRFAIRGK